MRALATARSTVARSATLLLSMCAAPPPIDSLVYSLVSVDSAGRPNMNIVTYCTPVAHSPERWYAVSLFHGTVSRENFLAANGGVLQILAAEHAPLVPLLGQSSARDVDKLAALEEQGALAHVRDGRPVLAGCIGCFELRAASVHTCGGASAARHAPGCAHVRSAGRPCAAPWPHCATAPPHAQTTTSRSAACSGTTTWRATRLRSRRAGCAKRAFCRPPGLRQPSLGQQTGRAHKRRVSRISS